MKRTGGKMRRAGGRTALALCALLPTLAGCAVCDVTRFGAAGDNVTDDTSAFTAAVRACAGGGEILLPPAADATAMRTYITGPFNMTSHQRLRVPAGVTLAASVELSVYPTVPAFPSYSISRDAANSSCRYGALVGAVGATNVSVVGAGIIDGRGAAMWWPLKDGGQLACSRPHLLEFERCTEITVAGESSSAPLELRNSAFWTVHWIYSSSIVARNAIVRAPATRGNTDGFNPDSTSNVLIENCYVDNGDDGVAIKSGMDWAGQQVNIPSENITVRNLTTKGRGGIAIGSEMSGGVRNVTVVDARLLGQRGVHMKTCKGRGGFIENVALINVSGAAIQLWPTYSGCNASGPWPHIANISVANSSAGCSVACKGIPASHCDAASFVFENACGHTGPTPPPAPTPPSPAPPVAGDIALLPCAAPASAAAKAQQWSWSWNTSAGSVATAGFVACANQTLNVHQCSRQAGATVGAFPISLALAHPSKCGNHNLEWGVDVDTGTVTLRNANSGLCLDATAAAAGSGAGTGLRQTNCNASVPGQKWQRVPTDASGFVQLRTLASGGSCLTLLL